MESNTTMASIAYTRQEVDRYLSYGFVLIPLVPGTSTQPAVLWKKEPRTHITATNNAVEKWYNDKSKKRYNVAAVCEPSNIIVLDVDTKSAVYGNRGGLLETTAADLVARLRKECRPTEQTTKSGGTHMIFAYDYATHGAVSIGANVLCPGVEVKASGNMLPLAPTEVWDTDPANLDDKGRPQPIPPGAAGHRITGRYITEIRDRPEPMPVWLIEAVLVANKANAANTAPREYTPTAYDPNRYDKDPAFWLGKAYDKARAGDGRNVTGFWLAQQLHDNEYSYDQALYVMADYQRTVEDWARPMYAWSEARESLDSAWSMTKRAPATPQNRPTNTPIRSTAVHTTTTRQDTPKTPTPTNDTTAANSDHTTRQDTPKTPTRTNGMPTLPQSAYIAPDIGNGACPWLDEYIAYSASQSTFAWPTFHLAAGLWTLATVSARRIAYNESGIKYTPLYLLMTAPSSTFAKSTTARVAIDVLYHAGLGHLLLPDDITPPALIKKMAQTQATVSADARHDTRRNAMLTVQFAGQRGWFFDEFGNKLRAIMTDGSVHSMYHGLLRQLDDGRDTYEYTTLNRGDEVIHNPFLSLLACLTPADLTRHATKHHGYWTDGFWARFLFASPPPGQPRIRTLRPDTARRIPTTLTQPLRDWSARLGDPEVYTKEITKEVKKTRKETDPTKTYATDTADNEATTKTSYMFEIDPTLHTPVTLTIHRDAREASDRYMLACWDMVEAMHNEDLNGSYTRLRETGLRIAALFASLAGSSTITLSHWARAQQICETFREELHNVYATVATAQVETTRRTIEDKVIEYIQSCHDGATKRDIHRKFQKTDRKQLDDIIDLLTRGGDIAIIEKPRTRLYIVANNEE